MVTIIGLLVATISTVREIGRMTGQCSEDYDISRKWTRNILKCYISGFDCYEKTCSVGVTLLKFFCPPWPSTSGIREGRL